MVTDSAICDKLDYLKDLLQQYNDFMEKNPSVKETCFIELKGRNCDFYHPCIPASDWPKLKKKFNKLNDLMELITNAIDKENAKMNRKLSLIKKDRHYEIKITEKQFFKIIKNGESYIVAYFAPTGHWVAIDDLEFPTIEEAEKNISANASKKLISKEIIYSYE